MTGADHAGEAGRLLEPQAARPKGQPRPRRRIPLWMKEGLQTGIIAVIALFTTFPLPFVSIVLPWVQALMTGYRLRGNPRRLAFGIGPTAGVVVFFGALVFASGSLTLAAVLGVDLSTRHFVAGVLLPLGLATYNCIVGTFVVLWMLSRARRST